jgi:hypothetical protein
MPFVNLPPNVYAILKKIDNRLQKLETAKRFTSPVVTADPAVPVKGDLWLNSTSKQLKQLNSAGVAVAVTPSQLYGRATSTSATQSFTTASEAQITAFDTSASNGVTVNAGAGSITIVTTGRYAINARVTWAANATGVRRLRLMRGANNIAIDLSSPGSAISMQNSITMTDYLLTAGDVLTLLGYQTSGGALSLNATTADHVFSVTYVGAV